MSDHTDNLSQDRDGMAVREGHVIPNPARLGWNPIVKVEHYACSPSDLLAAEDKQAEGGA